MRRNEPTRHAECPPALSRGDRPRAGGAEGHPWIQTALDFGHRHLGAPFISVIFVRAAQSNRNQPKAQDRELSHELSGRELLTAHPSGF